MTDLSRRSWLKGAGLMSSLAVIGGIAPLHQLSAKEIKIQAKTSNREYKAQFQ